MLDTLGYLGKSAWDVIWDLWPLLFIALGLDALFRRKEIFGPVFWIGLGSVFLLTNFGILDWSAWRALLHLWPVLLVTAGLEILLGKRSIWLSLLGTIAVLSVLAIALGLTDVRPPVQSTIQTTINEPLGMAEQADVSIVMGVGDLKLYALETSNTLISGEISTDGAHVRSQSKMRGETIVYSIEYTNPMAVPFDNAWQWELGLSPEIPMELQSSMGVGSMDLAMNETTLDELNISQGVGEIQVNLPDGDYYTEIGQAVGRVVVEIPEDVHVRLDISRAVSGLSVPAGFEKHNDYYYSPGAREADKYIRIKVNQAVGSINVRYK